VAGHRYRINKIKRMHSIVHGLLPILEDMARHPAIAQITPGRISGNRHADDYNVTMQYFTESGMKLIARTPTSVQEVFIVTSEPEEVQIWLINEGLIEAPRESAGKDDKQSGMQDSGASKQKRNDSAVEQSSRPPRSQTTSNQAGQSAKRRKSRNNKRAAIADKYGHEPDDILTDLPTDTLLITDHLNTRTAAKLRQLRDQIAVEEEPQPTKQEKATEKTVTRKTADKRKEHGLKATAQTKSLHASANNKQQASVNGIAIQPTDAKQEHAKSQGTKKTKKETNLLEAWLNQADDETFRRLSRKYKGSEK
jgi:hypothetical protein